MTRDLNSNSCSIFTNDAPPHYQLQGTHTFQQKGPLYRQLHSAFHRQTVAGFKKDSAAADIQCKAGSKTVNSTFFQQLVFNFQCDRIPLV